MPLLPWRRSSDARSSASTRPRAALKITPGAFDEVNTGHSLTPFIATPPGQGAAARQAFAAAQSASYAFIYRTQPAVRKVIDYIASNAAVLGLNLYEREEAEVRTLVTDHPAVESLRRPGNRRGPRRFFGELLTDYLIYENAYALKFRPRSTDRVSFLRVPVYAIEVLAPASGLVTGYRVHFKNGEVRDFDTEDVLHLCGYDPDNPIAGVSRLETLRLLLAEEAANQASSTERHKQGGLGPGYITRPLEAPELDDPARQRFETEWAERKKQRKEGEQVDPLLEEGMEFHESSVTPRDAEMLRSRLFTRAEVASLYGLPAVLVEAHEKGTDREDARNQFYADCLPPLLDPIAEDFDLQLLDTEYGIGADHFFAWNYSSKLTAVTAQLYKTLTGAAGAPILTRDEAREMDNRPPIKGGDEIITPLNVVVGDKPTTDAMPPQNPNGPSQDGDERTDEEDAEARKLEAVRAQAELIARRNAQEYRRDGYASKHTELLRKAFKRQEKVYKSTKIFSVERWDAELADDLEAEALKTVEREGGIAADRLAIAEGFDLDRVRNYLRSGAEEKAHAINTTTAAAIERDEQEETEAVEATERQDAFEHAKGDRAEEGGFAIATGLAAFSHFEAARQTPDAAVRVKTWVVTSGNSRHPHMQGETVPVFNAFSNGGQYPGDHKLGPDETARCKCLLEVS